MEIDEVSLARWLSTNKQPSFSPEPLFFFLCAVSLLILIYVLLRGIYRWQVMKLDEDVKNDLAQMKDYLLERRKIKLDRFKGDENIRQILGIGDRGIGDREIGDRAASTVDQETMEQWLARERNKEEEKRRRQKKFSSYMGNTLAETREKTPRQQPEDAVRKRRQKTDGLSKAYKRAEETSGEKLSKKK